MLPKLVFSLVPIAFTAAMIATEIPAAMRPYSMAVAPDSSLKNARILTSMPSRCFWQETPASGLASQYSA